MQPYLIYGNAWILAKDTTGRLKSERETYKAAGEHLIGYVYVDHQAGVSMMVHHFCKIGIFGRIIITSNFDASKFGLTIRFGLLKNFETQRLSGEQVRSLGLPMRPDYMDSYDNNEEHRKLRFLNLIDPLRASGFPDDFKFAIIVSGRKTDEVWGRLEKRLGQILYECILLNTPHQDLGVKAGDRVVVRIEKTPRGIISNFICPLASLQKTIDNSPPYKW